MSELEVHPPVKASTVVDLEPIFDFGPERSIWFLWSLAAIPVLTLAVGAVWFVAVTS